LILRRGITRTCRLLQVISAS